MVSLPQIGNVVKPHVSNLLTDFFWFGAPISVNANWEETVSTRSGIGIGLMERAWVDGPPVLNITIETILGASNVIDVNNVAWNLNDYILSLLNAQGMAQPETNQAILSSIGLNFNANDIGRATFAYTIFRPDDVLQEWFDTYGSVTDIPWGDGTQLSALSTEDVEVIVPDDPTTTAQGIDGIRSASIQAQIQWTPIETHQCRAGFVPQLPVNVDMSFELYNDYFIDNQSLFRKNLVLSDINIWKFQFVAPKIITVNQSNPSSGARTWNLSMRAKNIIKEI